MRNFWRRHIHSLFFRLVLLFLGAFLLIAALEMLVHIRLFEQRHFPAIQRNTTNYCTFIADQIGAPPDTTIARQLSRELEINVHISGPDLEWSSLPGMKSKTSKPLPALTDRADARMGFEQGVLVELYRAGYRFFFRIEKREEGFHYRAQLLTLLSILVISLVIFTIYLSLRYLLRPIRILQEGVCAVIKGNVDVVLPGNRKDELGELMNAFNNMSQRIREMLRARDRLLLDVSHELRSPLTRAKVALEFLPETEARENIATDIRGMETMITEILESERLQSTHGGLRRETLNLVSIIREVAVDFNDRPPGVKMLNLPEQLLLEVDPDRIVILLRNVLDNAIKFSPPDGYAVEISLREKPGELTVEIQDFGVGIPEAELPYIFEPFYRVDKSRSTLAGGYGLGMSICKLIMEAHGGSLEVASKPRVGTTVLMRFPRK